MCSSRVGRFQVPIDPFCDCHITPIQSHQAIHVRVEPVELHQSSFQPKALSRRATRHDQGREVRHGGFSKPCGKTSIEHAAYRLACSDGAVHSAVGARGNSSRWETVSGSSHRFRRPVVSTAKLALAPCTLPAQMEVSATVGGYRGSVRERFAGASARGGPPGIRLAGGRQRVAGAASGGS